MVDEQAAIARDQAELLQYTGLIAPQNRTCIPVAPFTAPIPTFCPSRMAVSRLQNTLKSDELKLESAKDQLKREPSG